MKLANKNCKAHCMTLPADAENPGYEGHSFDTPFRAGLSPFMQSNRIPSSQSQVSFAENSGRQICKDYPLYSFIPKIVHR